MSTGLETITIPALIPPAARCLECTTPLAFHLVFRHVKQTLHAVVIAANAHELDRKTQLLPTAGMVERLDVLTENLKLAHDAIQMHDQIIAALHDLIDVRTGASTTTSPEAALAKDCSQ